MTHHIQCDNDFALAARGTSPYRPAAQPERFPQGYALPFPFLSYLI